MMKQNSSSLSSFLDISFTDTPLHRWSLSNAINPLQQMRELGDFFLGKPTPLPVLHPRPSLDIRNRILPLAIPSEKLSRLTGILSRKLNLQNPEDPQRLIFKTFDRVRQFLGSDAIEMIELALNRSAGTVVEKGPLQGLVALEVVGEAKAVLFVGEFQEVEQLS